MRLLRFVAVACMVTVGVASLGCGGGETVKDKPAEETPAATSSTESSSSTETAEKAATTGTTPVSLTISGMS
jgi:hypothetical protein